METINELIATTVELNRDRLALLEPVEESRMTSLTYGALLERVHGFAGYLQGLKIEKGDRILLWAASRIDWMVAFLGTQQEGAVMVHLAANSRETFLSTIPHPT